MFTGNTAKDVAVTSLLAGGASGAVVCVGSAPFELVKVGPAPSPIFFITFRLNKEARGRANDRSDDNSNTKYTETLTLPTLKNPRHPPRSTQRPTPHYPIIQQEHQLL